MGDQKKQDSGHYSCSLCRQIYKRILALKSKWKLCIYNLDKELLCLLEKGQNEYQNENLRFMLQTMMNDKHSSSKNKEEQTTNTESEVDALSNTGHNEQSLPTKIKKPCILRHCNHRLLGGKTKTLV